MTKLTVSYSEISTARQCPHKHKLAYQDRWTRETKSPALKRGTLWHTILETWYRAIKESYKLRIDDAKDRIQLAKQDIGGMLSEIDDTEERELLSWMWEGYLEVYGEDEDWQVLSVEQTYIAPLKTPTGNRSRIDLKIKLDLVVLNLPDNRIYVVDHKTARNMPTDREYALDDQFGLYIWGMKQIGVDIFGAWHSASRTQKNKSKPQDMSDRFKRTKMYRTDTELDTLAVEAYLTAKTVWYDQANWRSPDPDTCRWKCDYTEACLGSRKGMDEPNLLKSLGMVQDFTRH